MTLWAWLLLAVALLELPLALIGLLWIAMVYGSSP